MDLPVHPRRRHIFFTEPFPAIPGPVPLTTDVTSGFYFRKEMEQVLLSPGDVEDIGEDFDVPMDPGKVEEAVQKAIQRLPIIGDARIAGAGPDCVRSRPTITRSSDGRRASRASSWRSASDTASSTRPRPAGTSQSGWSTASHPWTYRCSIPDGRPHTAAEIKVDAE